MACSASINADVTRFHQLTGAAGERVVIRPAEPARADGLEFNRYADMVGAKLAAYGFAPPQAGTDPDVVAVLDWNVVETSSLRESESPVAVGVGVGGGSRGSGVGVGVSTGFNLAGAPRPTYIRRLSLTLTRTADGVRLFEGRVASRGDDNDMLAVMPYLVNALFKNFPGASGETITMKLPVK